MRDGKKHRLLIVDDELDLRELLSDILGSEGYDTVTASDGDEAIRILGNESFDAALLDILMPTIGRAKLRQTLSRAPRRADWY